MARSSALTELGRFTDGIAVAEPRPCEIAETADHPFSLTNALLGSGSPFVDRVTSSARIPLLERACELSRTRLIFHSMGRRLRDPLAAAYGAGRAARPRRIPRAAG